MAQLADYFDYKNRLMKDLLTDSEIVHLINDSVPVEDGKSLAYTQVFPYEYVPDTSERGLTYICCDVDIYAAANKTFLTPVLYIWVFAHRSQMRLPEGGVRVDALCNKICEKINGSRFYGLGPLEIYGCKRFAPQTDHIGKMLIFHTSEVNKFRDPKRPIPTNRKESVYADS